jgi:CDP-diacylglycerol--glycerol-3-phosphate 3-phosphatidyltransferase
VNLPNSITCARLILTVIFVAGATWGGTPGLVVALVSFILAAFSDWLDGHLARKLGLVTSLGKLLDPLADKILVSSAFIFFSSEGLCPVWVTAVIIAREFLVTGLRQIAVEKGKVIAADNLGKWKTTFQLTFGITTLVWLIFSPTGPHGALGNFFETLSNPENWLFKISLWGALGLTLLSGWNYLNQSRSLLRE